MSAETTTNSITPASGHVTIVFTSDWGVSTGVGQAGRTHSKLERGSEGQPVVRGTVITGVLREQASIAARALDSAARTSGTPGAPDAAHDTKGPWERFAEWLFGQRPDLSPRERPRPRHVIFTDASPIAHVPVHDTVSLSIDPDTGTARDQMLRFTERAAPGVLTGTFQLIDEASAPLGDDKAINAAHFLLGVAGLMVRGIGSGRSGGDGECTVAVVDRDNLADGQLDGEATKALARIKESVACEGDDSSQKFTYTTADVKAVAKALRELVRGQLSEVPQLPCESQERKRLDVTMPSSDRAEAGDTTWYEASLDIVLDSPIVSYEVPFSNEVRSLDFLRGTVVLPWLHRTLAASAADDKKTLLAEAVTGGHLLVSDALPVIDGVEGLPVPLTLTRDKTPTSDSTITLYGVSRADTGKIPVRGGYIFLALRTAIDAGPSAQTDDWYGKPPLRGRQTTAINSETGAASQGQLVLVEALPEGMRMRAHVWMSSHLWKACRVDDLLDNELEARLGSRKLTGTFGSARCTLHKGNVGERPRPVPPAKSDAEVSATIWFTSDVIARSAGLGPGGTVEDLIRAFEREGIVLNDVEAASIRHRRIDSWSPVDNGPRATRLAIQAGSVLRVSVSAENHIKLTELAPFGVGELTAQGYGRFVIDHPLLSSGSVTVTKAKREHFVPAKNPKGGEEK
ncbi:RAMP superfamily CRISPR-associated protein [Schaalia odontolytica]|uniref:RAMP superfamily CRISPR-associated protein n=1 Tax=Schaalia odontolytica TaxID=1660 RepID=UPI00211C6E61|nr:RAMP superfamily CRISPR-associated protein [Schaalia odontolytica]UUO93766.1 CRISPR-associated protein [Schaalia odontolytica]